MLSHDDNALEEDPVINVDYLSYAFNLKDIWVTRRYLLRHKDGLENNKRLENALWRTWTKSSLQLKSVTPGSINWAKDDDVTWLYGPQLNIETLSNVRTTKSETPCGPSQLPFNIRPVIKKRTAFSVTSKIPPRSHLPGNVWATLQNDYLKLHDSQPLIRVPWRQSLLIQVAAILVWYANELLKRIYFPLSSNDPVRVRFDREVQQCIAVEASIRRNSDDVDEQNSGKSRLVAQNCTSRGRRECCDLTNCRPDCRMGLGVFPGRTIRQIEPTKLKFQEEVDDANMEDDIPLL